MDAVNYNQLLDTASLAGKLMLENGAEIYRVEQTVKYVCSSFGVSGCEVFATPTTLIMSLDCGENPPVSAVRRITRRGVNLGRVEQVNSCSRNLGSGNTDLTALKESLLQIGSSAEYGLPVLTAASACGAAAFVLFFGGGVPEMICGFFLGALLRLLLYAMGQVGMSSFIQHIIGGAFSTAAVAACYGLGLIGDFSLLTISVLMLMVPGMLFTNALRDLAAGDLVAGISRATEAFCVAAALAGGAAMVYFTLQVWGGIVLW